MFIIQTTGASLTKQKSFTAPTTGCQSDQLEMEGVDGGGWKIPETI